MFNYINWFKDFPPELATLLIAMLPIAELRAALPVALMIYKLSFWSAFFWSVLGNMLPVIFILWLLRPVSLFLMRHFSWADKFFSWWFSHVRYKFEKKALRYGVRLALILFVAVPLPFTGAWTGAVASFLFGIPPRRALILIGIGVIIAGIIVTLLIQGGQIILR